MSRNALGRVRLKGDNHHSLDRHSELARPGTPFPASKLTRIIAVIASASAPRVLFLLLIACILAACGGEAGAARTSPFRSVGESERLLLRQHTRNRNRTGKRHSERAQRQDNPRFADRCLREDRCSRSRPNLRTSSAGPVNFSATFAIASLAVGDYQLAVQIAPDSGIIRSGLATFQAVRISLDFFDTNAEPAVAVRARRDRNEDLCDDGACGQQRTRSAKRSGFHLRHGNRRVEFRLPGTDTPRRRDSCGDRQQDLSDGRL